MEEISRRLLLRSLVVLLMTALRLSPRAAPFALRSVSLSLIPLTILATMTLAQGTPAPVRKLENRIARSEAGFTGISAIRELADRRVLVLDFDDQGLFLLDSTLRARRDVARKGDGPGEYRTPGDHLMAMRGDTDGRLWIQRATPAGEPPTFNVFSEAGQLVETVLLPAGTRLVGFGEGVVYVVSRNDADLEALERLRM